jgi:hypothetical protein
MTSEREQLDQLDRWIELEALRDKYREERDRRLRSDGRVTPTCP